MPGDKIRMEMSLEDIANGCAAGLGQIQVRLHLSQRVDDGSFSIAFNVVGPLGQAASINLLNVHQEVEEECCWAKFLAASGTEPG